MNRSAAAVQPVPPAAPVATGGDTTTVAPAAEEVPVAQAATDAAKVSDSDMEALDMEIKDDHQAIQADFASDTPVPNIWTHDEPGATEAAPDAKDEHSPIVSAHDEDELEKPSFLRRLTRRRQKNDILDDENDK